MSNKDTNNTTPEYQDIYDKIDDARDVDWDKTPVIEGEVVAVEPVELEDRETWLAVVDIGPECVKVWQSAKLRGFFKQLTVGDKVRVEYRGEKSLGKARKMHRFIGEIIGPRGNQRRGR